VDSTKAWKKKQDGGAVDLMETFGEGWPISWKVKSIMHSMYAASVTSMITFETISMSLNSFDSEKFLFIKLN